MDKRLRGGDVTLRALMENGVDTIFGIPGVHTLDIYDALFDQPSVTHILARHEQGAGYMADGYARATGKPGVALIVTGPGLTNVSTPIGQAYADSSPVLVVATNQERRYLDQMVGNLHEMTDQMGFMKSITKWNARIMEGGDIGELVARAFTELTNGRPRPVHLEIPLDILSEPIDVTSYERGVRRSCDPDVASVTAAADLISRSGKIVMFAGGGAATDEASPLVARLATQLGAPVITSATGKGAISADHPYALGAFGYRWSPDNPVAQVLAESDLAIVIGTGLGVRTTAEGSLPLPAKIVHIDIDPRELESGFYDVAIKLQADAPLALSALIEATWPRPEQMSRWAEQEVAEIRNQLYTPADQRAAEYLPYIQALRDGMERDAILVNDMTMMAYEGVRYFPVYEPRTYFFPRGFGTLGSAMPTALGAKIGRPERQVVSISGDGGFQFTMEEIGAAVQHRIQVQMVIFNDNTHSAVKAAQNRTYPGRFVAVDLVNPDYVKLADAYGVLGIRAQSPEALNEALIHTRSHGAPVLIDVPIQLESYEKSEGM